MTPSLLLLQLETRPDDDKLLHVSLQLNEFKIRWHGLKKSASTHLLTHAHAGTNTINEVAFKGVIALTEALDLSISTKLLRMMHPAGEHL